MNDKKYANEYLGGMEAQSHMEDELSQMFGLEDVVGSGFAEVSGDTYDWSLEIRLYGVDYKTFVLTKENMDKILGWGCSRFWINFVDSGHRYEGDKEKNYQYYRCNAEIYVGTIDYETKEIGRVLSVYSFNGTKCVQTKL